MDINDKAGNYKLKSGSFVYVCMTSDFFIGESDEWRNEAWDFIRQRPDIIFSLLTKRADSAATKYICKLIAAGSTSL